MKKIINGRLYDTDTAREIAWDTNMDDVGNFRWYKETLYRKKTGEYFLHGVGNGLSKYGEAVEQNAWTRGEKIVPLTLEEATAWAEAHMDADDYEEEFGAVAEDDSKELVSYTIKASNAERLRRTSRATGRTISQVLDDLIEAHIG